MVSLSPSGKLALDKFVASVIEEKKLPCIACGVSTVDDEEIYFNYGGFNLVGDPSSGEINKDSVFWLCSQTKMVVHLAALQLIERGILHEDTPVSTYLPVFENPIILDDTTVEKSSFKPATNVVRVQHLLNYTSGLFYPVKSSMRGVLPDPYTMSHGVEDPVGEFYNIIKGDLPSLPLKFEPGTDFAYGYSSDTLGFIIEIITGQTLEEYCHENIFQPLGMTSTSFYLTPQLKSRAIKLTFFANGELEPFANHSGLIEQDASRVKLHLGGVGLYGSMKDYLALLRHLLQIKAGKIPPNSILSAKTVQTIFTPALPATALTSLESVLTYLRTATGNQWSNALAIRTEDWPERRKKGSAFWSGYAGTLGHIDPETGVAVVFGTQLVPSLSGDLLEKLHGEFEKIVYSSL